MHAVSIVVRAVLHAVELTVSPTAAVVLGLVAPVAYVIEVDGVASLASKLLLLLQVVGALLAEALVALCAQVLAKARVGLVSRQRLSPIDS